MAEVLAITGGIGSGKSTVALALADAIGAPLLDVDRLCRRLLEPEGEGWLALRERFAGRFFEPNGQVDRQLVRRTLFADCCFRRQLNDLLHPLARRLLACRIEESAEHYSRIVVEVPLLYEAGWEKDFSKVIVVYADMEVVLARLMARDRIDRQEALLSVSAQLPLADKALWADHVIENSGFWWLSQLQILHLASLWLRTDGS